ncbi:MAG: NosD domain-containing protein [Candidatus Thorarchaeota archaeon]
MVNREYSAIILIVILFIVGTTSYQTSTEPSISNAATDHPALTVAEYTNHDLILITNNDDFTLAGFSGNGTEQDPYILSGIQILSPVTCIDIRTTTAHFIIEDSYFSPTESYTDIVILQNVVNGVLKNCIIESGYIGVKLVNCANSSLIDCVVRDMSSNGVDLKDCSYISMINTTINDVYRFIYQLTSIATSLDQCWFNGSSAASFQGDYTTVTNCSFTNSGTLSYSGSHVVFRDNYCYELGCGMFESGAHTNYTVSGNTFISSGYGVSVSLANNIRITNNTFIDNDIGIFFQNDPRSSTMANNTIYRNQYPIVLSTFGSSGTGGPNNIYQNLIGWNLYNARNTAGYVSNWDDGVRGNNWSQYTGTGNHTIDGGQADTDYHPSTLVDLTPPTLESPSDIEFAEGTTGHYVRWNISDDFPFMYTLDIDETLESHILTDDYVLVDLDSLTLGPHSLDITVYDAKGNTVTDTVVVNVIDDIQPEINGPPDIAIIEGTTGNYVVWTASDLNPNSYEILIDHDSVVIDHWIDSEISYSLDPLSRGLYNLTLIVEDTSGLTSTDTVLVTVNDGTIPTVETLGAMSFVEGVPVLVSWDASDLNPFWMNIYLNGSLLQEDTWNGDDVFIKLDSLDVGLYNLTLQLVDLDGNSASDAVIIIVYAPIPIHTTQTTTTATTSPTTSTTPTPRTPTDLSALVILSLSGVVIILVMGNLFLFRKLRTSG